MKTRAIDIDCPNPKTKEPRQLFGVATFRWIGCGAKADNRCNEYGVGVDLCQARINAAVRLTRAAKRGRKSR
jgi:hypothetical protein